MSALLSPLKSAIPATIHTAPDTVVTACVLVESAPSQITLAPLVGLRHRISALTSALKSQLPATCQGAANEIERASCRERGCRYVKIRGGAGTYKKQNTIKT